MKKKLFFIGLIIVIGLIVLSTIDTSARPIDESDAGWLYPPPITATTAVTVEPYPISTATQTPTPRPTEKTETSLPPIPVCIWATEMSPPALICRQATETSQPTEEIR